MHFKTENKHQISFELNVELIEFNPKKYKNGPPENVFGTPENNDCSHVLIIYPLHEL